MKIERQTVPRTAISTSDERTVVARGQDLGESLVRTGATRRKFCSQVCFAALAAAASGPARFLHAASPKNPQAPSPSAPDTDEQRVADLVTGNHILFDQGVLDGFGHISARSVKNPSHFWLSQSRAPGIVAQPDILEFNEDSEPVQPTTRPLYLERFIHGEIYRARPDVISVVHSHSPAVIPYGVTKVPLRPIVHTAGFLPQEVPVFEIRAVAGDDNGILVGSKPLGAALAATLGKFSVVLMRGHGDTVVGFSVKSAVYRAVYTQVDAQIESQSIALGQGNVTYLNSQEASRVDAPNESVGLERVWQIWDAHAKASLKSLE